ncbi:MULTISPECIES: hypothetical protein [unclassified Streptomyces]|uniref:hypothetical protein n=1 Tax=unclassified Streptomyces TaxID=2593676 RepID=UPI0035D9A47F
MTASQDLSQDLIQNLSQNRVMTVLPTALPARALAASSVVPKAYERRAYCYSSSFHRVQ